MISVGCLNVLDRLDFMTSIIVFINEKIITIKILFGKFVI